MSEDKDSVRIRPSARLIKTIGEDLIGDSNSAIIELVKNSYDADATQVDVIFEYTMIESRNVLKISVNDNGHGMSNETIVTKWLVPATNAKLKNIKSSKFHRPLQGRKGIGRFAVGLLGQEFILVSKTNNEKNTLYIDWGVFDDEKYLSDIELILETEKDEYQPGTFIETQTYQVTDYEKYNYWNNKSVGNLIKELRKLISPMNHKKENPEDIFEINFQMINSPYSVDEISLNHKNGKLKIEKFPIIDAYDYRLSGTINNEGIADLLYENNANGIDKLGEKITKHFKFIDENIDYAGSIEIDLRVFDRDKEGIANLVNKSSFLNSNIRIDKNEARAELNKIYGVNIYKNGFRIKPYGNEGVDWLNLDKSRIQNPSFKISNNQIVGSITIESEDISGLEEKSARDGLKDNAHFEGLKSLILQSLFELEKRRFNYRQAVIKSKTNRNTVNEQIDMLLDFTSLKDKVQETFRNENLKPEKAEFLLNFIDQEQKSKQHIIEDIRRQIAVYQGQATLGMIISVVLHEGRKSIQFFKQESDSNLNNFEIYKKTKNDRLLEIVSESLVQFKEQAQSFTSLFGKIAPLANQRNSSKSNFSLLNAIENSFSIFKDSLSDNNILTEINVNKDVMLYGSKEDILVAFTNLIENSIYWLNINDNPSLPKKIIVNDVKDDKKIVITYKDNGPGINIEDLENGSIFEPGFTTKINDSATGLGLAIAGEAVERLNGKLFASESSDGASFKIEFN